MHHRVRVLHTHPVCAKMVFHDVHNGVIRIARCPVALPLEHYGERGNRLGARLDHPLHRVVMSQLANIATTVFNDIDFVAVVNGLDGWKRDTRFRPQARQDDLLPASLLDRRNEVLVVPGIHGRTLNGHLVWKDSLDLRPDMATETFGLDRTEDDWNLEHPCGFGEYQVVVDNGLAIEVRDAKKHLRLKINLRDNA